ncbi:MAG: hypothetical protein DI631_01240 [Acinetobacter johnsonii]|nr:MAG: hypothetical protein DI631_01240 [Acinetobacter johnsonii]
MGIFSLNQMAQYPIKIYPTFIQLILIFVFPYAFTSFFPALYFLYRKSFEFVAMLHPRPSRLLIHSYAATNSVDPVKNLLADLLIP